MRLVEQDNPVKDNPRNSKTLTEIKNEIPNKYSKEFELDAVSLVLEGRSEGGS